MITVLHDQIIKADVSLLNPDWRSIFLSFEHDESDRPSTLDLHDVSIFDPSAVSHIRIQCVPSSRLQLMFISQLDGADLFPDTDTEISQYVVTLGNIDQFLQLARPPLQKKFLVHFL